MGGESVLPHSGEKEPGGADGPAEEGEDQPGGATQRAVTGGRRKRRML